jgi:sensor histidine kinase YesM
MALPRRTPIILLHAGIWLLVFSLPYLLNLLQQYSPSQANVEEHSFYLSLITNLCWMGIFYLNALVLLPQFIYRKRYGLYAAIILLLLLWMIVQTAKLFQLFYDLPAFNLTTNLMFVLFVFILMIASSIAYRMIHDRVTLEKQAKERETESLKTELAFLRSQISPHFVFNVLNNMVAFARVKSDQLEPSLIKLSSLLRYMLYETKAEKVLLNKEMEYLESYIELQSQRFSNKVHIAVDMKAPDKPYFLEPMLLIPFVENAFKHGTGLVADACISIQLYTDQGRLNFMVKNKYNHENKIKDDTSGIGLQNVKRRLELLYGHHHSLTIQDENDFFIITLQITF